MTIRATFQGSLIQAADPATGARTISGLAVPWDQPGVVADGTTVVFHPGSLKAGSHPVALRDHDRTRPIGTVTDSRDTSAGMFATITVSKVPAGDEALVLAGDGALPALSVGAEPTEWDYDADGTLHVTAADWLELSLLTLGAFSDARVGTVTAAPPGGPPMTMTDTPDDTTPDNEDEAIPFEPDDGEAAEPVEEPTETSAQAVPIMAARRSTTHPGRRHPYADLGIAEFARLVCAAAASGDARSLLRVQASPGARAAASIEAALVDVTLVGTDNVGAQYRPGYQAELVEIVSWGSPAVDAIRQGDLQRGDYPNKTFNTWTKTPQVVIQSLEKAAINSSPVAIAPSSVPVKTWATGNDLSQQLLDFGSPSFIDDYIRAAGVDYAHTIDLYAVTALLTAATDVTTAAGDNLVAVIGKLLAALDWTLVPAGALFALVSPDLASGAYSVKQSDGPAFWDGNINFGSFPTTTTLGGLTVQVDPNMPAATALLGVRNAATWYDLPGTPFSLRAINVGQLGLDIAVYGYGALGVQYPGALVKTTVPAA